VGCDAAVAACGWASPALNPLFGEEGIRSWAVALVFHDFTRTGSFPLGLGEDTLRAAIRDWKVTIPR
jgi:hypothetical protein